MAVGQPLNRLEGERKVTGEATYAAEAPMPDAAFGFIVQSTLGPGKLTRLDVSKAKASPGVIAILTPDNMPKIDWHGSGEKRAPLSDWNVLYAGQHLAVVVADTPERAREAASLIEVEIEADEPIVDMSDPRVITQTKMDGEEIEPATRGDVDAALTQPGLIILQETYRIPAETHNPMEMSATCAAWDGDRVTVWDATQGVSSTREKLAKAFGLELDQVRVFCRHLGGGFGGKGEQWPHKFLAVAAARLAGRPVRLVLTRRQMFTSSGHRPETEQEMTLAATPEGKLVALRHLTTQQSSPTNTHVESCGNLSAVNYAVPNLLIRHALKPVDVPAPTWMRAPGECPGSFALESAMDEMAERLGIDPIEFRLINHADVHPEKGKPWSTKNLKECYRIGVEKFRWERRIHPANGKRVGYGMATASYPAHKWPGLASVRLFLDGDGQVRASGVAASQDLGTGTWTIGAQVLAHLTGLPMERVAFIIGDSNLPRAGLSGGSATAANVSISLHDACMEIKKRLIDLAGDTPIATLTPREVDLKDDRIQATSDPGRSASLQLLLSRCPDQRIEAQNSTELTDGEDEQEEKDRYAFNSFGAHFVEVQIDDLIPRVEITRFVSVIDIARVLNPQTARNQVMGGIVMGIGMALMEHTHYDHRTGRVVDDNLADYLLPGHPDIPDIDVTFIGEPDYRFNPLGCRGVGEIGITGVAAAIANAVKDATGKRIRELPITIDKLL